MSDQSPNTSPDTHGLEMTASQRQQLQKEKTVKKGLQGKTFGTVILAIPKHLLKVTILIIAGAFLGMLWLINNDESLSDFLQSEEVFDFSGHRVHPLYYWLQKAMIKEPEVLQ